MVTIDSEFQALMPRLTTEEYDLLEQSILQHGCRDSIKLWNGILLDGHIRLEICAKHSIPYEVDNIYLEDRNEAILWILRNQLGRRNLTDQQRTYFMGMHYELAKWDIGENQHTRGCQNDAPMLTRDKLAGEYGVCSSTITRAMKYKQAVDTISEHSEELKDSLLSGELDVPKKDIMQFAAVQRDNPDIGKRAIDELIAGNVRSFKHAIYMTTYEETKPAIDRAFAEHMFNAGLSAYILHGKQDEIDIEINKAIAEWLAMKGKSK